jgi:hypothetical protein
MRQLTESGEQKLVRFAAHDSPLEAEHRKKYLTVLTALRTPI